MTRRDRHNFVTVVDPMLAGMRAAFRRAFEKDTSASDLYDLCERLDREEKEESSEK